MLRQHCCFKGGKFQRHKLGGLDDIDYYIIFPAHSLEGLRGICLLGTVIQVIIRAGTRPLAMAPVLWFGYNYSWSWFLVWDLATMAGSLDSEGNSGLGIYLGDPLMMELFPHPPAISIPPAS